MINRITIQEKELDAARAEFFMLTDKKFQLEERNHRLKDSRETNFQKAMDDLRQYKDGVRMQAPVERDQVISEMKTLWLLKQTHEEELAKLKKETKSLDKDIHINKKELKKWTDYREQGRSKMEAHIRLLNEEIVSMHENFEVIKASLRENLVHSMEDIDKNADETIKRKQEIAAEVGTLYFKYSRFLQLNRYLSTNRTLQVLRKISIDNVLIIIIR